MPARSIKQRRAMAIAEHHPEKLNEKNRSLLGMSQGQLHDFASTSERGLPEKKEPGAFRKAAQGRKRKSSS